MWDWRSCEVRCYWPSMATQPAAGARPTPTESIDAIFGPRPPLPGRRWVGFHDGTSHREPGRRRDMSLASAGDQDTRLLPLPFRGTVSSRVSSMNVTKLTGAQDVCCGSDRETTLVPSPSSSEPHLSRREQGHSLPAPLQGLPACRARIVTRGTTLTCEQCNLCPLNPQPGIPPPHRGRICRSQGESTVFTATAEHMSACVDHNLEYTPPPSAPKLPRCPQCCKHDSSKHCW